MECDIDSRIENEQFYIDILSPYFNIQVIANSNKTLKFSDETRKNMSDSAKKLWATDKRTEQASSYFKEQWKDESYREKIIAVAKKTWESEDYRKKMSDNAKKQWEDPLYVAQKSKEKKEWWLIKENWDKMHKFNITRTVSEEQKIKISQTLTGTKWSEERRNSHINSIKKTGYSLFWGVSYCKNNRNWRCSVTINGRFKHIGAFTSEIECAIGREHYIICNGIENQRLNHVSSSGE